MLPIATRRRFRQLLPTYAGDWLIVLLFLIAFFAIDFIRPSQREFSVQDKSISYTFTVNETVPVWLLGVLGILVPIVLVIAAALVATRSPFDVHQGLLGLFLSLTITLGITNLFKVSVGRLRPDFLARCIPRTGTIDPTYGLVTIAETCQQKNIGILWDGSKSFLSGHASTAFAGLGFLAFFLAGKMHVFNERGHTLKPLIVALPIALATLIAVSRIVDNRHHWHDIVSGSVLGLVVAYFTYRQFYPHLGHPRCHKPFSPRVAREGLNVNAPVDNTSGQQAPQIDAHLPTTPDTEAPLISEQEEPAKLYPDQLV